MNNHYLKYLESEHWKRLRKRKLDFSGYACNRCQSTDELQVHHVYYRKSWYDTILADLEVLCRACHEKVHHKQKRKFDKHEKRARAKNVNALFKVSYHQVCGRY